MKNLAKTHEQERKRIANKKNRGFIERNHPIANLSKIILLPVLTLVSAFSAYPALYSYLYNQFGDESMAFGGTVLIAGSIEIAKWVLTPSTVDDYFDKVWEKGQSARNAFVVKFIFCVGLWMSSALLSITGAPEAANFWRSSNKPFIALTDTDIRAEYAALIAIEKESIKKSSTRTYAGKLVPKAEKAIQKSSERIANYQASQRQDIDKIDEKNAVLEAEYNQKTATAGSVFTKFAGVGEVASILLFILGGMYEDGVDEEMQEAQNADFAPTPEDPNGGKKHHHTSESKHQVWDVFKTDGNTGYTSGSTGLNKANYQIHYTDNGLPYVLYKGAKRSEDWIDTQITVAQSKLRRNEDKPESVQKRLDFYQEMKASLMTAQAAA